MMKKGQKKTLTSQFFHDSFTDDFMNHFEFMGAEVGEISFQWQLPKELTMEALRLRLSQKSEFSYGG